MREDERDTQELRTVVYHLLERWEPSHSGLKFRRLAKLLGHKDLADMLAHYTVDDANRVRLLAGSHGYAVYKMLLARMEDNAVAMEASSKEHG